MVGKRHRATQRPRGVHTISADRRKEDRMAREQGNKQQGKKQGNQGNRQNRPQDSQHEQKRKDEMRGSERDMDSES